MFRISQKNTPHFVFDEYFLKLEEIQIEVLSLDELVIRGVKETIATQPTAFFTLKEDERGMILVLQEIKAPMFRKDVLDVIDAMYGVVNDVISNITKKEIDIRNYTDASWMRRERF